ncbi:hypothetical protein Tco_0889069 [Tanacetum coccineum]
MLPTEYYLSVVGYNSKDATNDANISVCGPRCLSRSQKLASMSCARLRSSAISNLSITQNSHNSLNSCLAYSARSCNHVNLPLVILSDSQVTTLCCFNDPTLSRRVIVSSMADVKLVHKVSMSTPTDSIWSGGGGTAIGGGGGDGDTDDGSDVEGDLDLLQDKDGKSDGGGEDDDVKSDGSGNNDGISYGSSG